MSSPVCGAGSLARTGHEPPKRFNIDWKGFRKYLDQRYNNQYAKACYRYARKYQHLIHNPSMLETFNKWMKNNVMKSLIAFSKYHGFYLEFKDKIKSYGIKWSQTDSIDSFFRIMNRSDSDILEWYRDAVNVLGDVSTYLRFVLLSGLRRSEALDSYNMIIELHRHGKLHNYYNDDTSTLEHFRYRSRFLRHTKNVFISIVPNEIIEEVTKSSTITYETIRKRLYRRHMPTRINELRDYYGTFMVRHGLIREEVDLLQGRISKSIFVRHYWSPAIKELKQRVLKALKELESNILS